MLSGKVKGPVLLKKTTCDNLSVFWNGHFLFKKKIRVVLAVAHLILGLYPLLVFGSYHLPFWILPVVFGWSYPLLLSNLMCFYFFAARILNVCLTKSSFGSRPWLFIVWKTAKHGTLVADHLDLPRWNRMKQNQKRRAGIILSILRQLNVFLGKSRSCSHPRPVIEHRKVHVGSSEQNIQGIPGVLPNIFCNISRQYLYQGTKGFGLCCWYLCIQLWHLLAGNA